MAFDWTSLLDPAHLFITSQAQDRNEQRADSTLELQRDTLNYQKQYDEKQFQLATSPISTVLKDADKNGINPMVALGQNVGTVSSSVSSPSGVSPVPTQNNSGLLGSIGSAIASSLTNLKTNEKTMETQKDIADLNADVRREELALIDKHNKAIEGIERDKNRINENYYSGQLAVNREHNQIEWGRLSNEQYNTILNAIDKARMAEIRKAELRADLYKFQQKLSQDASQFSEHEKKETARTWIKGLCYAIPSLANTLSKLIPNIKNLFSPQEANKIGF